MRVLIADDEVEIARALRVVLEREKCTADIVHNGLDALDYILHTSYDVIVLDIMMPGLSGLEVLRKLREAGVLTPVLFLSARGELEDRVAGLNARSTADGFAEITVEADVTGSDHLHTVMKKLEQISGVMRVTRPAG